MRTSSLISSRTIAAAASEGLVNSIDAEDRDDDGDGDVDDGEKDKEADALAAKLKKLLPNG